jgi:hypothetical protein
MEAEAPGAGGGPDPDPERRHHHPRAGEAERIGEIKVLQVGGLGGGSSNGNGQVLARREAPVADKLDQVIAELRQLNARLAAAPP